MNCATHQDSTAVGFCRECGRALCETCRRESQGVIYCEDCSARLFGAEPVVADAAVAAEAAPIRMEPSEAGPMDSGSIEPGAPGSGSDEPRLPVSGPSESGPTWPGQASPPIAAAPLPPPHPPAPREEAIVNDGPSPALAFILGLVPGVGAVYNGQYAKAVLQVVLLGGVFSLIRSKAASGLEPLLIPLVILFFFYMPLDSLRTARSLRRGESVDEFSGPFSLRELARSSPVAGIVLIAAGIVILLHSLGYWHIGDLLPFWPAILIAMGVYMVYERVTSRREEEERGGHMYDDPTADPHL